MRLTVFLVAERGDDEVYPRLTRRCSSDRGDAGPESRCAIFTLMRLALLLRIEKDVVTGFPHCKKGGLRVRGVPVG
ncbi:MAG: hypothetical protein QXI12_05390 [Candidatus Methanomethyliaceae archaeon]